MKKTTLNKLSTAVGNGAWQLIPSIATLLVSLLVVRLFSAQVWGIIVGVIVIQQITNGILAWGNKDFLQRELAGNNARFNSVFSAFFRERIFLFFAVVLCVYFLKTIEKAYFIAFVLLVSGRFLQQSFDIIMIKERKFQLAVWLEIITLVIQVLAILGLHYFEKTDMQDLFMALWLPLLLKGFLLLLIFRRYFTFEKSENFFLGKSLFFAMLSVTGLVHSKIDLLLVSKLLNTETLGKYQIVMAFLWNIQSVAMYVSGPYIHNFYRLNEASQQNYADTLRKIGFFIVPLGVVVMLIVLHFAFHIATSFEMVLASLLFSVTSFIYLPWILQLNREKKENRVLFINVLGTIALVGFMMIANTLWGLTLERTLWIVTFQQLFITVVTFAANKSRKVCPI